MCSNKLVQVHRVEKFLTFFSVSNVMACNALMQERGRPPKVHLQDTVEEMHKFNAIRKLKVPMFFFVV